MAVSVNSGGVNCVCSKRALPLEKWKDGQGMPWKLSGDGKKESRRTSEQIHKHLNMECLLTSEEHLILSTYDVLPFSSMFYIHRWRRFRQFASTSV